MAAHYGGGVGRALSSIYCHNRTHLPHLEETFISLEAPQDTRHVDTMTANGARVLICPDQCTLQSEMERADIIQLEWWHHPLMAGALPKWGEIAARWVVWSHVSGLGYPAIPTQFSCLPHAFITSTPLTLPLLSQADRVLSEYVPATGGFDDFHVAERASSRAVSFGYMGSMDPAKIHPDLMDFVDHVHLPGFMIDCYGDSSVNPKLEAAIAKRGKSSSIRLRGFTDTPHEILSRIDIFIYLLAPTHFGSTENVLLEAMASGVVPIVLNNPVEQEIVRDGITGLVVDSPQAFQDAVTSLLDHPEKRAALSRTAAHVTRDTYSVENSALKLRNIYLSVMHLPKRHVDFALAFGHTPDQMFRSCLGEFAPHFTDDTSARSSRLKLPFLYSRSKSSIFQFHKYFPSDPTLAFWAQRLLEDITASPE